MNILKSTIIFLLLTTTAIKTYGQTTTTTMNEFDTNFSHTVFFWLENPESKADKAAFVTSLRKFLKTSKHAKTNFIGYPPSASREVVDGSFTFSLQVTFPSAEEQKKYQNEEAHLLFIKESSHLWTKVIVYDAVPVE